MKHPVDVHVGQRLRHRRWLLDLTQQQLAGSVGVQFQQIQKYESGANRISASRMWDLAQALDVPVNFFFEGLEKSSNQSLLNGSANPEPLSPSVLDSKETIDLVRAYYGLDENPRKHLLEFAKSLSHNR